MPVDFSGKRIRPSPADVTHASTQLHPSFLTSLHALLLKKQGQTGMTEPGVQRLASRAFSLLLRAAPQSSLSPLGRGLITCSISHLQLPTSGHSQADLSGSHAPSSLFVKDHGSSGLWESQKSTKPSQILWHLLFFLKSSSWSHVSS